MNIQTSPSALYRPQASVAAAKSEVAQAPEAQEQASASAADAFVSSRTLNGPLGRAVYGAALYGIPAIAGATMGINGVIPGAVLGAGIGAATHLENGKQAGIFAATGAVVGGAAGYLGFLGAAYGFKIPAVLVTAAVGAGTQALFSLAHENQQ